MNILTLLQEEFRQIIKSPRILIPIIVVILTPIIYAGMFIWAFKDPYVRMDQLPVAVVNQDKGAKMNGESFTLGKDLEKNLKKSDAFDFRIVSESKAMEGLDDQKYYMVVKIPEDFSENATTLLDKDPKKLQLQYVPNDSTNFLVSQIGGTAMTKVKDKMATEVSKTYAETIFDKATEMANGFKTASNGAKKLNNGAGRLEDGVSVLKKGADQLYDGQVSLNTGIGKVNKGAKDVNNGTAALNSGMQTLKYNLEKIASSSVVFTKGISDAKDGSDQLAAGTSDLKNGLNQLATAGSKSLLPGAQQLQNGAEQLETGSAELKSGLDKAQSEIPNNLLKGTAQLQSGVTQMKTELPTGIAQNISSQLNTSASNMGNQLMQAQSQISEGMAEQLSASIIDNQVKQVDALVAQVAKAANPNITNDQITQLQKVAENNVNNQQKTLKDQLQAQINKGLSDPFNQIKQAAASSIPSEKTIASNISAQSGPAFDQLSAGISKLNAGIVNEKDLKAETVSNSLSQLAQGAAKLKSGAVKLNAGEQTYVTGLQNDLIPNLNKAGQGAADLYIGAAKLVNGLTQLDSGAGQLKGGAGKLADGSSQLVNGSSQLSSGTKALASGTGQLVSGSSQLVSGTKKLSNGSDDLSNGTKNLKNGTKELKNKLGDAAETASAVKANDKTYSMMADPVTLKIHHYNRVPNYGTGFTPYFLSLGLFVGALIMTIVYSLVESAGLPKSGFGWFASKFGVLAVVGVLQAIIADIIILNVIGIHVQSVPLFVLFSVVTSLAFTTLIQFLVTYFQNPGRFLAIVILILQLTSSAGTFPLETVPKFIQAFNPILPMTYSVQGFKAVVSSGEYNVMWHNTGILFIFILCSSLMTLLFFVTHYHRQYKHIYEHSKEE